VNIGTRRVYTINLHEKEELPAETGGCFPRLVYELQ